MTSLGHELHVIQIISLTGRAVVCRIRIDKFDIVLGQQLAKLRIVDEIVYACILFAQPMPAPGKGEADERERDKFD